MNDFILSMQLIILSMATFVLIWTYKFYGIKHLTIAYFFYFMYFLMNFFCYYFDFQTYCLISDLFLIVAISIAISDLRMIKKSLEEE